MWFFLFQMKWIVPCATDPEAFQLLFPRLGGSMIPILIETTVSISFGYTMRSKAGIPNSKQLSKTRGTVPKAFSTPLFPRKNPFSALPVTRPMPSPERECQESRHSQRFSMGSMPKLLTLLRGNPWTPVPTALLAIVAIPVRKQDAFEEPWGALFPVVGNWRCSARIVMGI
jgi:hypothetical protein